MALTDESNGFYMPVAPAYGYGGNNGGFGGFGGDWAWIILLLLAFGGGWGFGGGMGGYGNMMLGYDFPWLLNGQNGINNNISDGFRDAQLHDSVTSVRDGVNAIATQLCGCCGDVQMALSNGFSGISQQMNANAMADLNRSFAAQTATTQGLSAIQSQLAQCCCDNRLATCQTQNIVQNEGNATRFADANNTRDIIDSQTRGTQAILDKLCNLELDAKNDTIAQLRQELLYARGQASQDVQTATLRQGQIAEVDALYDRLSNCPVSTVPVYGRQPIFTCNNNGCGCNGSF